MRRYPGGGAFALFFHPHPREFATQNKKSANARGLARGGLAQLEWTDALGGLFKQADFPPLIDDRSKWKEIKITRP